MPKLTNWIDKLAGIIEAGKASNSGRRCEEAIISNLNRALLCISDCKATMKSP